MSASNLDALVLNTDRVVRLDQMVLDSRQLNYTVVGGKSAYDANDLTYNSTVSTYDGTLTELAYASSALGGLSASAVTTPSVIASASASLGALSATANSLPSVLPTFQALLNGLTATAQSVVTHQVTATSGFGSLTATVNASVTDLVSATAPLGALQSSASTIPQVLPLFQASLGGLTGSATSTVTDNVGATALLGELTSQAIAIVIHPEPPAPSEPAGHYRPYYTPPVELSKALPEPPPVQIVETPKSETVREILHIKAIAYTNTNALVATAQSKIEWSILEDEAELLLLL